MKVRFNDLYNDNKKIEKTLLSSFKKMIKKSSFIGGKEVKRFEENFKNMNNSKYCVSCANGSDALVIAIKALGIKPGDEIITTSLSWIATSAAITMSGGKVIFCDVERDGFNIDVESIKKKISTKTVGIIPVHLYGHPANMLQIMKIAKKFKLWVIEDCAQSHLAKIDNKIVGNFGDFGAFSLFPAKNLGALGDAGCLVTNNKKLANRARLIATHGGKAKHLLEGINSRLDSIQASFLNLKIKNLKKNTFKRIKNSKIYDELFKSNSNIKFFKKRKNIQNVFHQYTILVKKRNELKKYLSTKKIETNIYYSNLLPDYPAYNYIKDKDQFINGRQKIKKILSLPINENLNISQIKFVANTINNFYNKF